MDATLQLGRRRDARPKPGAGADGSTRLTSFRRPTGVPAASQQPPSSRLEKKIWRCWLRTQSDATRQGEINRYVNPTLGDRHVAPQTQHRIHIPVRLTIHGLCDPAILSTTITDTRPRPRPRPRPEHHPPLDRSISRPHPDSSKLQTRGAVDRRRCCRSLLLAPPFGCGAWLRDAPGLDLEALPIESESA